MSSVNDFDFLSGHDWEVTNRVLKKRLVGSGEWDQFVGLLVEHQPILGGLGNSDRMTATRNGVRFQAMSLRVFDPETKEWQIYWLDNQSYQIFPQVRGRFVDGVGVFYGSELYQGKEFELRFLWTDLATSVPKWEQAYRDETTGEWETNWTMEFRVQRS